jgi:uncharacterized protein YjbI with pentapeptide repeats
MDTERGIIIVDANQIVFCNVRICDSQLANVDMFSSKISCSDITTSNIYDCDIKNVVIEGNVDFSSAHIINFPNIDFSGSKINNAIISNSVVNDSIINESLIANADIVQPQINKAIIGNSHILDSLLSNVRIEGIIINTVVDYTNQTLNGRYSKVIAASNISQYQSVEVFSTVGGLRARATDPSSRSSFFGVAQANATAGLAITLLNEGVSYVAVRKNINLPVLVRVGGQCMFQRDATGKIVTQSVPIPILVNDLLVLAGTNSDILAGPLTQFYPYNAVGNDGLCTVYKSLTINPANCSYIINTVDQNNWLALKQIKGGRFIQVLEITADGRILGLLI